MPGVGTTPVVRMSDTHPGAQRDTVRVVLQGELALARQGRVMERRVVSWTGEMRAL